LTKWMMTVLMANVFIVVKKPNINDCLVEVIKRNYSIQRKVPISNIQQPK
jgi:hypothetical protein